MPQFLIPAGKKAGDSVNLSPEESRHLAKVLRAKAGDRVKLTDGSGSLFRGRITAVSPRGVTVAIEEASASKSPNGRILLAQGLLKGEKMEFVLQKAAELGAAEVLPFTSSRTVAAWKKEPRKLQRWQKIAEGASKQSGRATHLKVTEPAPFAQVLKTEADDKILFWEEGGPSPKEFLVGRRPDRIVILIGPEGGLSQEEVDQAFAAGFVVLSLGPLTLRAETAAMTALAIVNYELGNF
ncbi:MAG TPA: 16S rRNA (uracil(1498)-N(3))-methyltransferase [bacterium]|nr:16S rRNA (uracil(1498)-N(3))-methyltransferase [bacterium]